MALVSRSATLFTISPVLSLKTERANIYVVVNNYRWPGTGVIVNAPMSPFWMISRLVCGVAMTAPSLDNVMIKES